MPFDLSSAFIFFTQNVAGLHGEIRSLQSKLSEVSGTSIQQGERLREVRKAKRELDQENADLKAALKNAQVCSKFCMLFSNNNVLYNGKLW